MTSSQHVDLAVLGAGPSGLFATYYAGFRGLSVALIDSLPELGGQVTAMYPEKPIYDVAGFPAVKGRDLVAGLVRQAESANPVLLLERTATKLAVAEDVVELTLDDDTTVHAKALIITAGIGRFAPRPLPSGTGWVGRGLSYFVPDFTPYVDQDVVIVGGGDSAFDWAEHLTPLARSVRLVHRRAGFRAHESTVARVLDSAAQVTTDAEVTQLQGGSWLEAIEITHRSGEVEVVPCQRLVAALGFIADLGPLQQWGLQVAKRHLVVDSAMMTNVPRVFAAGDVVEYPGKVRLIAVGFGEAATAVNNAAVAIDPTARIFPGHSSEG